MRNVIHDNFKRKQALKPESTCTPASYTYNNPSTQSEELKRKHGNISAWVRGRLKAEVGPEHWPENFELAVQENDQPELKFPSHIETLNELRAPTVGQYRPTNSLDYNALLNTR